MSDTIYRAFSATALSVAALAALGAAVCAKAPALRNNRPTIICFIEMLGIRVTSFGVYIKPPRPGPQAQQPTRRLLKRPCRSCPTFTAPGHRYRAILRRPG